MADTRQTRLGNILQNCCFKDVPLALGEVLFREGDPGDTFYIVASGRLRAVRGLGTEDAAVLGEIARGEPVGEMAVLGETVRSASVVAVRDSHLMEFHGSDIEDLPKETLLEVMRTLADRLKRSNESGKRQILPGCLTIVPLNAEVPVDNYCAHLEASLGVAGKSCTLLSSSDVPETLRSHFTRDPTVGDPVIKWIEEHELKSEFLLLQTDSKLTGWSRRCLRYGDVIILLGDARSSPVKGEIEAAIQDMQCSYACPYVFLVLIQNSAPYRGTDEWLQGRGILRHYHVRLDSESDKRRAARLLSGTDISLALGGGGARGFAHIGILRAFEDLEIPIDRIGGTSMGAIVAALRAQGLGWKEIMATIRKHFIDEGKLTDFTLPLLSIDTGKRYIGMLERMFGDQRIEDLPVNYFCISCNLTRAKPVVHRRGSLAKWIGASVSVPGIAPPLVENGELLVDGGLLNNLPVDVIKEEGAGTVIGVDVSPETDLRMPSDYSGRPRAMEVLQSRLRRGGGATDDPDHYRGFPTLANILYRSTCLSSVFHKESLKRMADLYIKVPVDHFKMLDWKHLDEIVEIGYQTGLEKLALLSESIGPGMGETQYFVTRRK